MTPDLALRRTGDFARGARLARTLQVSPIKASYLVERRGERFVLRVDRPLAKRLGLDRSAEFAVLNAAWRAGFAPEPIAAIGGGAAILVTRFAPGRAWRAADLREPRQLERLAGILRELHRMQLPGPRLDLEQALARYAAAIGTAPGRALAARARKFLPARGESAGTLCLCHNDPIPANVVGLRNTVLIDWEYAAVGDPFFDLAAVVQHHRLPETAVVHFAAAYCGGVAQVPWARLRRCRALYDHVRRLWLSAVAAQTADGAGRRVMPKPVATQRRGSGPGLLRRKTGQGVTTRSR